MIINGASMLTIILTLDVEFHLIQTVEPTIFFNKELLHFWYVVGW